MTEDMIAIFSGAWQVMNIPVTIGNFTFALWHPMGFIFIITMVWSIFFGGKQNA